MPTDVRLTAKYSSTSSMASSVMEILTHCLGLVGERLTESRKLGKSSETRGGRRNCGGDICVCMGGGRGCEGYLTSIAFTHYLAQLNYLLKLQGQLGMKHQETEDLLVVR